MRHADLSRSTDPVQVKPDQWDPLVSLTVMARVTDMWGQVNAHISIVKLTRGPTVIRLILILLS